MQHSSRDVILLASTTAIASSTGVVLNIPDGFIGAMICIQVTAASGTSPTLNVFLQDQFFPATTGDVALGKGTGTVIFDDFYAATQFTTTATKVARFTSGVIGGTANAASVTTCDYAISDAALTAGSIRPGPLGNIWRVKFTIGGTSPSFTFNVTAKLTAWV
jgi:hypothetical protein